MHHEGVELHNVGELRERPDGHLLQRVPEAVRRGLNDQAATRMRHPAGVEVRLVTDGTGEVTLSSPDGASPVEVFWGPFHHERITLGPEPTTLTLSQPEKLADLRPAVRADLAFDPAVCRLRLAGEHRGHPVRLHGVGGDRRPPGDDEIPDRRYLAYGTSITEGERPAAEHLTYAAQTADRLGADLLNLGTCGSAYCDPALADHVAARDDWDVATLSLSVNMVGEFSVAEFRERASAMVDAVAGAHPETPVACVTLFPYSQDLRRSSDREVSRAFREALREAVAALGHDNTVLLAGPDLLDPRGLTTDLVHPGDVGMRTIAERLSDALADRL